MRVGKPGVGYGSGLSRFSFDYAILTGMVPQTEARQGLGSVFLYPEATCDIRISTKPFES